jgi:transcriptional regulator with XRE-family HTH domain
VIYAYFHINPLVNALNTLEIPMENKDWILHNILRIRKLKGKQGPEMAKELGIVQGTYSKLENGKIKDYFEYLPKIAQVLGVSFHELINPQENQAPAANKSAHITDYNDKQLIQKLMDQYEEIIRTKHATIMAKDELLKNEREIRENYKDKYERLKIQLEQLQKKSIR